MSHFVPLMNEISLKMDLIVDSDLLPLKFSQKLYLYRFMSHYEHSYSRSHYYFIAAKQNPIAQTGIKY